MVERTSHSLSLWGEEDACTDPQPSLALTATPSRQAQLFDPVLALGHALDSAQSMHHAPRTLALVGEPVREALRCDAAASRVLAKGAEVQREQLVGIRLNLNFLKATGFAVHSVHAATNKTGYRNGRGFWNGPVLSYEECVTLRHAFFNVSQKAREQIAAGSTAKFPMASIDGTLESFDPTPRCEGIEVAFNPKREHLFRLPDGQAIWYAERVVVFQHRAFAAGLIVLHTERSAPGRAGTAPTEASLYAS